MWSRIQLWIVKRWLLNSAIDIVKKDNGYTNIQIKHPLYGILVLHPNQEQTNPDREDGFYPSIGYRKESAEMEVMDSLSIPTSITLESQIKSLLETQKCIPSQVLANHPPLCSKCMRCHHPEDACGGK